MTASKINCSTECSLYGLEDYRLLGFVCQEGQYSKGLVQTVRIRLRDRTEGVQYRIRLRVKNKERYEEDRD
jgi:hypothetical protein